MKRNIISVTVVAILFLVSCIIPASGESAWYEYDDLKRVKKVICEDGTTVEYDYDKVGNRTTKQVYAGDALSRFANTLSRLGPRP